MLKVIVTNPPTEEQKTQIYARLEKYFNEYGVITNEESENEIEQRESVG